ncbi:tetratricopeptide repeat protein [Providencia vermicola]|uniref:tetratricopeptide repeat protein n=1 Tax=Providencia TaxID=586 RepID=UPI00118256EA|nr:tetratricopeptide repeat protein [Providencia rettgeri]EMB6211368.1 sel1 repeat family protein [Morganella morganii]
MRKILLCFVLFLPVFAEATRCEVADKSLCEAAEKGNADAQNRLGIIYSSDNQGVKKDYIQAYKWFMKSAEQGSNLAKHNLGMHGDTDYPKDFFWTTKMEARDGDEKAQYSLGRLYYYGEEGVETNINQAFQWFKSSAEQGNSDAQWELGLMYSLGEGVKQDYHQAFLWIKKAAEQGNGDAQALLGHMYIEGLGIRQDHHQSKEWFGKSCDNGNQKGCDGFKKLNELGY